MAEKSFSRRVLFPNLLLRAADITKNKKPFSNQYKTLDETPDKSQLARSMSSKNKSPGLALVSGTQPERKAILCLLLSLSFLLEPRLEVVIHACVLQKKVPCFYIHIHTSGFPFTEHPIRWVPIQIQPPPAPAPRPSLPKCPLQIAPC